MTYRELDEQLGGRTSKSLGGTLTARRGISNTIDIHKVFRRRSYLIATVDPGNVVTIAVADYQRNPAFLRAVAKVLPPTAPTLALRMRYADPYWSRYGRLNQTGESVLVPYTPGDRYDMDARYLHAQARNNF